MGCGASVPAWEAEHTNTWRTFTLTLKWSSFGSNPQTLNLTIVDESGGALMTLDGGVSFGSGHQRGSKPPLDAVVRSPDGQQMATQYTEMKGKKAIGKRWSMEAFTRRGAGHRAANWTRDESSSVESTLPATVSVNFTGGIARAWRDAAPAYDVDSPAVANKKRIDDLLGYARAAHIPKGADMGTYGRVKEATLVVDPRLVQRASKGELSLFLAMLCDFYWTQGADNWFKPAIDNNQTQEGAFH